MLAQGVPIVIKSDHSVTNAQHLVHQAAKAMHYGLTPQQALTAITSAPAVGLGLADRIGSIQVGLDADIVVWDGGAPVTDVGAWPAAVIIDGFVVTETKELNKIPERAHSSPVPTPQPSLSVCDRVHRVRPPRMILHLYNIKELIINETTSYKGPAELALVLDRPDTVHYLTSDLAEKKPSLFTSQNSRVLCVGAQGSCSEEIQKELPSQFLTSNLYSDFWSSSDMSYVSQALDNSLVFPAPIAALTGLGLTEINQEAITKSGTPSSSLWDTLAMDGGLSVADGLKLGISREAVSDGGYSKMLTIAARAGVWMAVVAPDVSHTHMVMGRSALIRTGAPAGRGGRVGVVQRDVAMHIQMGKTIKGMLEGVEAGRER